MEPPGEELLKAEEKPESWTRFEAAREFYGMPDISISRVQRS
jgi:hypothetical protein